MVPHGDRGGVPIEPFLTDQWYVNAAELARPAIAAVREGRTKFVPKAWEKTYFDWMENIQPWCVSRQLWWGHQIPAWYGPDGHVFVEKTEEDALHSAIQHYIAHEGPMKALVEDMLENFRPGEILTRDEDVLDTWFSSALWPFSTLGWPDRTPELKTYYPTSVLVTGFDIIFFWVARMMMMGLHFMDEEPFHTVYVHALVRDKNGAKMSKSKGNVIDPLELIEEYGADALRFTLAILAAQGRDVKLDPARVAGYRNFGTKLWNATRFAQMNGVARNDAFWLRDAKLTINRWILTELTRATRDVTEAIAAFRFNDAAGAAYRFVWNLFCDWYLELLKPVFMGEDAAAKAESQAVAAFVLDEIYKLLHPFMPFMTEELWARTAGEERALDAALPRGLAVARIRGRDGRERDQLADRAGVRHSLGALRNERAPRCGRAAGRRGSQPDHERPAGPPSRGDRQAGAGRRGLACGRAAQIVGPDRRRRGDGLPAAGRADRHRRRAAAPDEGGCPGHRGGGARHGQAFQRAFRRQCEGGRGGCRTPEARRVPGGARASAGSAGAGPRRLRPFPARGIVFNRRGQETPLRRRVTGFPCAI